MNTDVLALQDGHSSIRQYQNKAIEADLLQKILLTGTRAATSGNMQFYAMVLTQDPQQKQKLYQAHGEQAMILQAPVLITFCADLHRMQRWFDVREAKTSFANEVSLIRGIIDASLLAQNVVLAAEAMDLGTCYMGSTLKGIKEIVNILNLPKLVVPVTTICMGYPAEEKKRIERLPLAAVVHNESYDSFNAERIDTVYSQREQDYWLRFTQNPQRKKVLDRDNVSNVAQAYRALKYDQQELEDYSKNLWECYQTQFLSV
ncbi:MAG TPA: nitroreductase family protein [Oligoflexia bacterium]|nr:nitroreductase family protein [Oligoflexia bacterium]HMR24387.1 nitroreductase family protein [Oligoflexia bacterium]